MENMIKYNRQTKSTVVISAFLVNPIKLKRIDVGIN